MHVLLVVLLVLAILLMMIALGLFVAQVVLARKIFKATKSARTLSQDVLDQATAVRDAATNFSAHLNK